MFFLDFFSYILLYTRVLGFSFSTLLEKFVFKFIPSKAMPQEPYTCSWTSLSGEFQLILSFLIILFLGIVCEMSFSLSCKHLVPIKDLIPSRDLISLHSWPSCSFPSQHLIDSKIRSTLLSHSKNGEWKKNNI